MKYFKHLRYLSFACLLGACGGGGDSATFTITRSLEGTTHSCTTRSAFDACEAGNCNQCVCTAGCDTNAPKAKLALQMTPAALSVDQPGTLQFRLSSAAAVNQTVSFTLNYPSGQVGYSAIAFTSPCITMSLGVGGQSTNASVIVPANTSSCTFEMQKRFAAQANPVAFVLSNLDKVELDGALPSVTVSP